MTRRRSRDGGRLCGGAEEQDCAVEGAVVADSGGRGCGGEGDRRCYSGCGWTSSFSFSFFSVSVVCFKVEVNDGVWVGLR